MIQEDVNLSQPVEIVEAVNQDSSLAEPW